MPSRRTAIDVDSISNLIMIFWFFVRSSAGLPAEKFKEGKRRIFSLLKSHYVIDRRLSVMICIIVYPAPGCKRDFLDFSPISHRHILLRAPFSSAAQSLQLPRGGPLSFYRFLISVPQPGICITLLEHHRFFHKGGFHYNIGVGGRGSCLLSFFGALQFRLYGDGILC